MLAPRGYSGAFQPRILHFRRLKDRRGIARHSGAVVVDESEMKDDLVQDMVDVLTWFCARLYGRRTAKNRAAKALAAAQADG